MERFKLPTEAVANLKQSQRDLHDILGEFDKMQECGIECQEYRQLHQEAGQKIEAILKHYGQ